MASGKPARHQQVQAIDEGSRTREQDGGFVERYRLCDHYQNSFFLSRSMTQSYYKPFMKASKHSTRAVATAASTSKLTFDWSRLRVVMVAVSARIERSVRVCIVAPFDKSVFP